ncbi:MAG: hypothetical protein J7501_13650 [Bdellovibrio sp.]|nr:hypothetical protein [Bdellovibrio sp.]
MKRIFTHEIKKIICHTCKTAAVVTEVDYRGAGEIVEIRMWSEQFKTMIAVDQKWLSENFPKTLSDLKHRVEQAAETQVLFEKVRLQEINNDQEIA